MLSKFSNITLCIIFIILLFILGIIISCYAYIQYSNYIQLLHQIQQLSNLSISTLTTDSDISALTDLWCNEVANNHNPEAIYKLFCEDGNLVGTVSQVKRKGRDIKTYFNYFAKLPNIKIINKEYNISKVVDNVFINTAFITWFWDGLEKPIIARMTFVYRDKCIFQLHSSALPELNTNLLKISKVA